MKVAVAAEGAEVFQHFGRTPEFVVAEVEGGAVRSKRTVSAPAEGCGGMAPFLKNIGADVLIAGGMGAGAKRSLESAGLKLMLGVSGPVQTALDAFATGKLATGDGDCGHHDHEESHEHHAGNGCNR